MLESGNISGEGKCGFGVFLEGLPEDETRP